MYSSIDRDRMTGVALAFGIHGIVFLGGGLGLLKNADYGIDVSKGTTDIELVAAASSFSSSQSESVAEKISPVQSNDPDDVLDNRALTAPATPTPAPTPSSTPMKTNVIGDGSSPVPGRDATTLKSQGTDSSYGKPSYLRNPPPSYPLEAKKQKQEGRVLLTVFVNADGKVTDVRLARSSGFALLDDSAVLGVQKWRFKPARVGGIAIDSSVEVPIRFQLK